MREKMLKHHFEQGIPKEFHSALIAAKCQTNADRVHIIEQLQHLESDTEDQPEATGKNSPETVRFIKYTGGKPTPTQTPEPKSDPAHDVWKLKVEEQLDTLSKVVSPALLSIAATLKTNTNSAPKGGGRGGRGGRGGWKSGRGGGNQNSGKNDQGKKEDSSLNEKGTSPVAQGAGPSS
jgi:hypothetical protein